jgi:2-octaprenyl-6-methoxyphenol hydroxylase
LRPAGQVAPGRVDVLVAGAGLVGLCAFRALHGLGLRVALCDRGAIQAPPTVPQWDTRVFAISPGSARLLGTLGAWDRMAPDRVQPIESMRVFGDAGAVLNFSAYSAGAQALAWIAENSRLVHALHQAIAAAGEPSDDALFPGAEIVSLETLPQSVRVGFADGRCVEARLVIAADGAHSVLRTLAGIEARVVPYGQTAVVANFACERPHHGRAWQWFRPDGAILALLPLPGRRVSIVWSAPEALAAELLALPGGDLAGRVGEAAGHVFGGMALTEGPAGYPLGIVRADAPSAGRVLLVGDAAHGIHPLAGQGVNLGFGDVSVLADVLRTRGPVGDPGAESLLGRFRLARAEPVLAMQWVTDGLWRFFDSKAAGARELRNAGMRIVERSGLLKRALMQPALR